MAKATGIAKFTNSLTEYLINAMANKYTDAKHFAYRYNNLKVYMDPNRITDPHFFVQIGISEACYSIETGRKMDGGLGPEDALVSRWAGRANIYNELKKHWKALKDAITAEMEDDIHKRLLANVKLRRSEQDTQKLETDVDMTGTGIDKQKRTKLSKRLGLQKYSGNIENDQK